MAEIIPQITMYMATDPATPEHKKYVARAEHPKLGQVSVFYQGRDYDTVKRTAEEHLAREFRPKPKAPPPPPPPARTRTRPK